MVRACAPPEMRMMEEIFPILRIDFMLGIGHGER